LPATHLPCNRLIFVNPFYDASSVFCIHILVGEIDLMSVKLFFLLNVAWWVGLGAGINFGGKDSGIKITSGGTFSISSDIVDVDGTIEIEGGGVLSGGNKISFKEGRLDNNGDLSIITGDYIPDSSSIVLSGGDSLKVDPGTALGSISVSGTNNKIEGQPSFTFPVCLLDSATTLILGLQSVLTQSVQLNGGTLLLSNDLFFGEDMFVTGSGVVNTQGYIIRTGGKVFSTSSSITWDDGSYLDLQNTLALSDTWTIDGTVYINANGNIIDLSNGNLTITAGSKLYIVDGHIAGLDNNTVMFEGSTSALYVVGSTLALEGDITITSGRIIVEGESTFLFRSYELLFTNDGRLVVDGGRLLYKCLETFDFVGENTGQIDLLNGGSIESGGSGALVEALDITSTVTLTKNYEIDESTKITVALDTDQEIDIDFSGHSVEFALVNTGTLFQVNAGVGVRLFNVVLKNFSPARFDVHTTSTLVFADNTTIQLGRNETGTIGLSFTGNCFFDGKGYAFDMASSAISVGANSCVTIRNVTLKNMSGENIRCIDNTGKIIFENVVVEQSSDFKFAQGSIEFGKEVDIKGGCIFSYESDQTSTIRNSSTLTIDESTTMSYAGSSSGLVFESDTARLALSSGTLSVATAGLELSRGALIVDAKGAIESAATQTSEALLLGNELDGFTIALSRGALLTIRSGVVKSVGCSITFGSKDAGIIVANGAEFNVGDSLNVSGLFKREFGGVISGNGSNSRVFFNNGEFFDEDTSIYLTADYAPTTTKLFLTGGKWIKADDGIIHMPIEVSGIGNNMDGNAGITYATTLQDSSAALTLGMKNALNNNVVLNGGSVTLSDHVGFVSSYFLQGPGNVYGNGYSLKSGSAALSASTSLHWHDKSTISLNNTLALTGTWTCDGAVSLNGDGNIIDVSNGSFVLNDGASLRLSNAEVKGVGANSFIFGSANTSVVLENVRMTLDEAVTLTQGGMKVSANSTFILKENELSFDGSSTLSVDGSTLFYDTATFEFNEQNSENIILLNGGEIKDINNPFSVSALDMTQTATLTANYILDPQSKVTVTGGNVGLDFAGHIVTFANVTSTLFRVNSNTNARTYNTVFKDFSPQSVSVDSTSTLVFDDNTIINLGKDESLTFTMTFAGSTVFDGNGHVLDLLNKGIEVKANSVLVIKDVTLRNVQGSNIRCLSDTSSIVFENVTIEQKDNFTFATGAFEISRSVTVVGGKRWIYSSDQISTIRARSTFIFEEDGTFVYAPAGGSKSKLFFADKTAQLYFHKSTLEVASTGAEFQKGIVVVDERATVNSLATQLTEALKLGDGTEMVNDVTVVIKPNATMRLSQGFIDIQDA